MPFDLDAEVDMAVAALMAGKPPKKVLRRFAERARNPVERIVEKHTCTSCGCEDVLCFTYKARATLGDKAWETAQGAAPIVAMKFGQLAQEWVRERARGKRQGCEGV